MTPSSATLFEGTIKRFTKRFNAEGQPTLNFGIAEDALPGTVWIHERTSDLKTFDEIYHFDGTTHFSIEGLPIDILTTETGVTITDKAAPAGLSFYRIRVAIEATE